MQNKVFSTNKTLYLGGRLMDLNTPKIMGILNVTPDSFFDGGKYTNEKTMLANVEQMLQDGADIIDIGGYSSRPGAEEISAQEEASRVISVFGSVIKNFPQALLSIDTFRTEVARQAIEEGAVMVNDISGGELDKGMFELIARHQIPYVLMHMRGTPVTMNSQAHYENLLKEITDYFHPKINQLHQLGVSDILVDPGFGFAKTVAHNFELLKHLDYLQILEKPLVVGLSRKSLIWRTLETDPDNALNGTSVLNTIALLKGASLLRIHDVKQAVEVVKLTNFVR